MTRLRRLAFAAVLLAVAALPAAAQGGTSGVTRPRDRWVGPDKLKHFLMSAFVQSVGFSAARATGAGVQSSMWMASALTTTVGVAKEWRDRGGSGFSARDLVWDAAGAGSASLLLRHTTR